MNPSEQATDPRQPAPDAPLGKDGSLKPPRSNEAGSDNTLGDGRTAGGGYNADRRDELTDRDAGESHGDRR